MPTLDAVRMRTLVSGARDCVVGWTAPDGGPTLCPADLSADADTLTVGAGRAGRVTVLVQHYDDDWTRCWWVRMRGDCRPTGDGRWTVSVDSWRGWSYLPL